MKRCAVAKPAPAIAGTDAGRHEPGGNAGGSSAGVPLFLRPPAASGMGMAGATASGRQAGPPVQMKCACGGSGGPCAACAEKEKLQRQAASGGAPAPAPSTAMHAVARSGVEGAHEPLPHLDRIQASFGRRDVRGIKAQVGGAAGTANERMGSIGYTVGDRVGFRSSPDVRLAAHEAAHAVQQRDGVQLEDGVGHPGDGYEQHADAVADAVARGESAEPLLDQRAAVAGYDRDASANGGSTATPSVVQHQLAINATRQFEDEAATTGGPAGQAQAGAPTPEGQQSAEAPAADRGPAADAGEGGEGEGDAAAGGGPAAASGGGHDAAAAGAASDPAAASSGGGGGPAAGGSSSSGGGGPASAAPASSAPDAGSAAPAASPGADAAATPAGGGGSDGAAGTAGPQCSGSTVATCYDAPSDQPAQEPAETPENPDATKTKDQTSDEGEEDAPEPDNCTPPAASGGGGGPAPAASGGGAPAAPDGGPTSAPAGGGPAAAGEQGAPAEGGGGGPAPAGGAGGAPGDGGGGTPAGPMQAGASPMDGAIGASEGQRAAAVAAFANSSSQLQAASEGNTMLRGRTTFAAPAGATSALLIQRDEASQRASQFFSSAAEQIDQAIAFVSTQVPEQLGAQAEAAKSQIATSIDGQKVAISARVEGARAQAHADAAMARQQVEAQAAGFIADAESQAAAAIETLTTAHTDAVGQVTTLETTTLDTINQKYATGRTDLEGLGTTVGAEATATGESYAATYRGFRKCTSARDTFWDGDLSERRSEAQENAAISTAKGYHDRIVDGAKKRAREIVKAGRKEDRCVVLGAASTARETLDSTLSGLVSALEHAREQTIQQAGSTRDSLIASIDDSLATTLRQLDKQEHDQRQMADDTGYLQQVLQEQMAHAGAASLQRVVANAATTLQSTLGEVQALIGGSRAPDPAEFEEALAAVEQRVNGAIDGLHGSVEGGLAMASQQLAGAAQEGLASLENVTQSADDAITGLSGGFTTSMSTIAGTDNFAAQRTAFAQLMQKSATDGSAAMTKVVDGVSKGCTDALASADGKLKKGKADLETYLRQSKQGLECDIVAKATEAASHEAPRWKRWLAILLIIVVIIIIIAVIVVTAGGAAGLLGPLIVAVGPVFAAAIVGAVVGAVTSALITMAQDLWGNRTLSATRTLKAAAIGFVTGAIGGAAGAWVGGALQGFSLVVQYGAAMALAGGMDVITQFVLGGLSFEHFSWSGLGLTLLITALTLGLAHGVQAVKGGGVPHGGPAPPEGGAPVSEGLPPSSGAGEPVPTSTAGGEPVPTSTAGGEPVPPSAAGGETPPTAAAPETPSPTAAPETPATAPETTPSAAGPETAPPSTGEPAAPASTPESTPSAAPETEGTTPTAPQDEVPASTAPADEAPPSTAPEEAAPPAAGENEGQPATAPEEEGQPTTAPEEEKAPTSQPEEEGPPTPQPEEAEPQGPKDDTPTEALAEDEKPAPETDPDAPRPWEDGKNPKRYQRYVRNLQRRQNKAGIPPEEQRKPLDPAEWWEQHGQKTPNNPHGGDGKPDHRAKTQELRQLAESEYPPPRYQVRSNQKVPGLRQKPDAAVIDTFDNNKVVKVYEAARFDEHGVMVRPDEHAKIIDYNANGIPYEFHPVGPNAPAGGVLRSPPAPPPTPTTPTTPTPPTTGGGT